MAISWQTGEPPCETNLIVEYEFKIGRKAISMLQRRDGAWYDECDEAMPTITVLRWSTLDDDRAAMAMGALEKYIKHHWQESVVLDYIPSLSAFEAGRYDSPNNDASVTVSAPSLIEAIEKLTADQQTKGATDEA